MRSHVYRTALIIVLALLATAAGTVFTVRAGPKMAVATLNGRIVAAGIPGISAITQVGTFLPGGPVSGS